MKWPWSDGPLWPAVLATIGILAAGVGATAWYVPPAMHAAAIEAAYQSNLEVADQIKITREYYTRAVVKAFAGFQAAPPSSPHEGETKGIPLASTFVKDISELLRERDVSLSLVSPYPWPHRADRQMDDFEWSAWRAFQEAPDSVFSRQEVRAGKRVLRVAVADRMTAAACVNCHNKHPESAKKDWKIGDVRGVMDVTKVIEGPLTAADARSALIISSAEWVAGVAAVSIVLIAALVSRRTREKDTAHEHIRFLAHHDALTGLLNRISFKRHIEDVLRKRMAMRGSLAVYYVDLDELKEINDKLGHEVGDAVIHGVAERLRENFASATAIARVGGDEFAIAQLGVGSAQDAERQAAAVIQALSKPYSVDGRSVTISASVGIYLASQRLVSANEVLNAADLALYRAKAAGRRCTVLYNEALAAAVASRRKIEHALRAAVQTDAFELYFQPICSARVFALEGFEALLRLRDDTGTFIAPSEFIPVAEQIGLIDEIGAWVLNRACAVASHWPSHLTIAVNLSPAQFRYVTGDARISQIAARALASSGLDPKRLEVEITESLLLERTEEVIAELRELKALGVKLVMDDFGTGYSSLSYLWKLPLDKLKIDRSFVAAPATERGKVAPILQAITTLGRLLNMRITAEGVETQEQLAYLAAFSCDQLQGYIFGKPLSSEELSRAISRSSSLSGTREVQTAVQSLDQLRCSVQMLATTT